MQCQGRRLRKTQRKQSLLQTLSPTWKFSLSLSFSLLSVLTLVALLRGSGSDLLEALSTNHLVLISIHNQF